MTIYRYGREGLVSYNLTEDELVAAHLEYQTREDETTVIGILDAAGLYEACDNLTATPWKLRKVAEEYRKAIEFSYDGAEELEFVLKAFNTLERKLNEAC